jgi:DNA polymerase III epsilon subunit-like protein
VSELLKDKLLVGHALKNDLDVLFLSHPRLQIRDTSRFRPYMRVKNKFGKLRPRALRDLTQEFLGKTIQQGEHDSAEDARCAVFLYRLKMLEWETSLRAAKHPKISVADNKLSAGLDVAVRATTTSSNNFHDESPNTVSNQKCNRKRSTMIENV